MQKVYLLLRNNIQAGPYSLDELLAAGIKQTDLIWVEGKSGAWRYPSEIKELIPYLPASPVDKQQPVNKGLPSERSNISTEGNGKESKKIFVSLPFQQRKEVKQEKPAPSDSIEQKAEALRQKLQAYSPQKEKQEAPQPIETNYTRSLADVEEDYTSWRLKQAKKKRPTLKKNQLYAGLVAVVVIAIPLYFIFRPAPSLEPEPNQPQIEALTTKNVDFEQAVNEETSFYTNEEQAKPEVRNNSGEHSIDDKNSDGRPVAKLPPAKTENEVVYSESEKKETEEEVAPEVNPSGEAAQEIAKKKTLGEAIDGFFGKFKSRKKEETEATPGTSPDATGERRGSKRTETGAATPPPDPEQLVQLVKVTANEPAENWMLGIKGLKLTLHNQSDYKLSKAAVEVAYFDEQNTLLEKKTVLFQNVPANKTVTLGAPDHRLASYAKHQLLTVSGE